jgi:hypothetical protein
MAEAGRSEGCVARAVRYGTTAIAGVLVGAGAILGLQRFGGWSPEMLGRSPSGVVSVQPTRNVERAEVQQLLEVLKPEERQRVLASDDSFRAFVDNLARDQSVLRSAYAEAADAAPGTRTLMRRAAQRVLVEQYLRQIVRANIDASYPDDAAMHAFYDENPDRFTVPEGYPVWQIFFPGTSSTERQNAQALARQSLEQLLSGKADFGALATRYSRHEPSRRNGGYMGLLPTTEIKPEIRTVLEAAPEGKVVGPVETKEGFHLVKRGPIVAAHKLEFAEAQPQIEAYLRREARVRAQRAAVDKMVETYPVSVPTAELATWRSALLAADSASSPAPPENPP